MNLVSRPNGTSPKTHSALFFPLQVTSESASAREHPRAPDTDPGCRCTHTQTAKTMREFVGKAWDMLNMSLDAPGALMPHESPKPLHTTP